jgi:hypothetical protein
MVHLNINNNKINIILYATFHKWYLFVFRQWRNIDKVNFEAFGGTAHLGIGGAAESYVVITQLTITSSN